MTEFLDALAEHRRSLDDDFVPAIEASKVVARMRDEDPEALQRWMEANAETFATQALGNILRRERSAAIRRAEARRFAIAAAGSDQNSDLVTMFQIVYSVDSRNTRRTVADMTGPNHFYVAERYITSANRVILLSRFHTIVAQKLRERRTADVFPEPIYEEMLASILGDNRMVAAA